MVHFCTREYCNKRREFSQLRTRRTELLDRATPNDVNMNGAGETPKKACNTDLKICRCCNVKLSTYYDRVDLFGKMSTEVNVLPKLQKIGGVEVRDEDEDFLPTKICRKCFRKVSGLAKAVEEFQNLCNESKETQHKELENVRLKRGRKASSPTQEPSEKRRQAEAVPDFSVRHFNTEENNTRANRRISLFPSTPNQHPGSAVSACDILPLQTAINEQNGSSPEAELHGSQILKNAGLRNPKVSVNCV